MDKSISIPARPGASFTKGMFSHLSQSVFVKNLSVVMTGTAVAQAIGFALSPVVSRLFTPQDFGIVGSFTAVLGVVATFVTLQYSNAIILPKEDKDAASVLAVSITCAALFSLLLLTACLVAPQAINGIMRTTGVWALALLVLATFVTGVNQSFQAWCVRSKAFKRTSASQVLRSVSSNGSQVGAGVLGLGSVGLVISAVLADVVATVNLAVTTIRDWRRLKHHVSWPHMRALATEYRDFPIYNASMNCINALSLGLPALLLTQSYGLAVTGAYAFAMRILSTPMSFVLTALRQVLLQKATEDHNQGRVLYPLYLKASCGLFAVAVLPSALIFIFAPRLFAWLFGQQWALAGEFSQSLILWLLMMFCNVPATLFARIIRIQRQMFFYDIALLIARTGSLFFGGLYVSASTTVLLYSSVGAVMNVIFIVIVGRKIQRQERAGETLDLKNT
jgi:lipopolysaccharide exporter